jgi:hypothetical protein
MRNLLRKVAGPRVNNVNASVTEEMVKKQIAERQNQIDLSLVDLRHQSEYLDIQDHLRE